MEADELAGWLLEQEPSLILQWLHEMLEGTRPLPEGFNWHGLAELDIRHPITCFFEDLPFSPDEVLKIYAQEGKERTPKVH